MIRLIGLIFIFIFIHYSSFGQIFNVELTGGVPLMEKPYEDIQGSPYLMNGEWGVGSFIDVNGVKQEYVTLRFNSYENTFEYRKDNQTYIYSNNELIESLVIYISPEGDKLVRHFKKGVYIPEHVEPQDFVEVLFEGTYFQMLQKHSTELQKHVSASYGSMQVKKFVNSREMWLLLPNSYRQVKRLTKRVFIVNFPDLKKEINKFVKAGNIVFTDMNDIYELCKFIDGQIGLKHK